MKNILGALLSFSLIFASAQSFAAMPKNAVAKNNQKIEQKSEVSYVNEKPYEEKKQSWWQWIKSFFAGKPTQKKFKEEKEIIKKKPESKIEEKVTKPVTKEVTAPVKPTEKPVAPSVADTKKLEAKPSEQLTPKTLEMPEPPKPAESAKPKDMVMEPVKSTVLADKKMAATAPEISGKTTLQELEPASKPSMAVTADSKTQATTPSESSKLSTVAPTTGTQEEKTMIKLQQPTEKEEIQEEKEKGSVQNMTEATDNY